MRIFRNLRSAYFFGVNILMALLWADTSLCGQLHLPVPWEQNGVETERLYLLFWNGKEQITVQATLIENKSQCAYFTIYPSPAESSMTAISEDIFRSAFALIDKYFIKKQAGRQPISVYENAIALPDVLICPADSLEKWNWLSENEFNGWLQAKTLPENRYQDIIQSIRVALRYKYNWIYISHAQMPTGTGMLSPIAYRFATDKLILPLRMYADLPGQASMRILTFTPDYFTFTGTSSTYCVPLTENLRISVKEVTSLHPQLENFYQGIVKIPIQMWRINAPWSRLNRDLISK